MTTFPQLPLPNIFQELDNAECFLEDLLHRDRWLPRATTTAASGNVKYPGNDVRLHRVLRIKYLYENPTARGLHGANQPSSVVGDTTNSFCIDPNHIAPLSQYYTDLPTARFPVSASSKPATAATMSTPDRAKRSWSARRKWRSIINAFMASPSWNDSVFFLSYDEGGGPYDHVPPVPGHSNE